LCVLVRIQSNTDGMPVAKTYAKREVRHCVDLDR
jgi:hypothetical protein